MNSVSFFGILVLVIGSIRYGSEGIQGGEWKRDNKTVLLGDNLPPSYNLLFLGALTMPSMGIQMLLCSAILVNIDIAITAGHCILYDSRHAIIMYDFKQLEIYMTLGSLEYNSTNSNGTDPLDTFQKIRVIMGFVHENYAPYGGFDGIRAANDLGAVVLEKPFKEGLTVPIQPIFKSRWTDKAIRAVFLENEANFSKTCTLYSWGSSIVRPVSFETHTRCSSARCDREREASCLLPKNVWLKQLDIKLINKSRCANEWGFKSTDSEVTELHASRLPQVMDNANVRCFETKNRATKGGKNDSTTIGDEGGPVLCQTANGSKMVVGIFVGSPYKFLPELAHFDFRAPNWWIGFDLIKDFNRTVHINLGRAGSTRKNLSSGVSRFFVSLNSIIFMFVVCLLSALYEIQI